MPRPCPANIDSVRLETYSGSWTRGGVAALRLWREHNINRVCKRSRSRDMGLDWIGLDAA